MELRWRAFRRVSWIWSGWERLYLRTHTITPVRQGALFAVRRKRKVLELHLDSRALSRMRAESGYSTFRAVHRMREDLEALAATVRAGKFGQVLEVRGRSLMGSAGAVLGFETRRVPRSLGAALQQYFMVGIDAVYHPRGLREHAMRRWPVEIWMSVEELLRRYPAKSARSTPAR